MRLLGVEKISQLGSKHVRILYPFYHFYYGLTSMQVNSRAVERDIYDGSAELDKLGLWEKARL